MYRPPPFGRARGAHAFEDRVQQFFERRLGSTARRASGFGQARLCHRSCNWFVAELSPHILSSYRLVGYTLLGNWLC